MDLITLIQDTGWKVREHNGKHVVITPYENEIGPLPIKHPVLLHLDLYRKLSSSDRRYDHMISAHNMLWPESILHEWTERRFRVHCENFNYITLAAGASASKSYDIAKLAILFWYANPQERNVTIASVTLSSLMTRVWGYLTSHIRTMAVPLPYKYFRSNPPKILFELPSQGRNKIEDDTLHGIFSVTAKIGDSDQAIATWIGKHPKDRILIILDECTDMPMAITKSFGNLNSHPEKFQLIGIGNSNSTMDLHGVLSTPKNGWDSVSIELQQWDTVQPRGTCLYFSPYESPAITDPDPKRRAVLEKFLMGESNLIQKEAELGKESEQFYRWVLGFWKSRSSERTVFTEKFLKDDIFYQSGRPEWSGLYPLIKVAGLDFAISIGGDKCLLRIAHVGHTIDGKIKIDFGEETRLFVLYLTVSSPHSLERQIAEQTIDILTQHRVSLDHLAIDCTGQGRAIGEVIALLNTLRHHPLGFGQPMKIYSMSPHNTTKKKNSAPDIMPMSAETLWLELREYAERGHLSGLDGAAQYQLTNRRYISDETGGKLRERLESKQEYKQRMSAIGFSHSPDEADAAALIIQLVKKRLGIQPGDVWNHKPGPQDQYGYEKLQVHLAEKEKKYKTLQPDFSGGLEVYVKHTKYF